MFHCASVSAQDAGADDEPLQPEASNAALDMPETVGGGHARAGSYYYTSPLKKLGTDLFVGSYVLNIFVSFAYLAVVYPVQALFGHSKVETVTLWMLVPIAGPWFAQYEDSVKSKPFWRVVLIGDAALQATGLVLGLIGIALSGKRELHPKAADSAVELRLGTPGDGLAGLTLSVHTL